MKLQDNRSVKSGDIDSEVPSHSPSIKSKVEPATDHDELRIHSILVPIDFSDENRKAVNLAVQYALKCRASITLIHVAEPIGLPDFSDAFPLELSSEEINNACMRGLSKLARELSVHSGLVANTIVRHGRAWNEICTIARSLNVDLIVISTHGRTGMSHLLMGSTAERVVRHAHCPVLVVRSSQKNS